MPTVKRYIALVCTSIQRKDSILHLEGFHKNNKKFLFYLQLNLGIKLHLTDCSGKLTLQLGTCLKILRNSELTNVLLQNPILELDEMCYLYHMSSVSLLKRFAEGKSVQTVGQKIKHM